MSQSSKSKSPDVNRISVRLSPDLKAALRSMSAEYGVSMSEIMRLSVDGSLLEVLNSDVKLKFADPKDAAQVVSEAGKLYTLAGKLREEANMIGTNLNQHVRNENQARLESGEDIYKRVNLPDYFALTQIQRVADACSETAAGLEKAADKMLGNDTEDTGNGQDTEEFNEDDTVPGI